MNNQKVNDLTVYDYDLTQAELSNARCAKILALIACIVHLVVAILSIINIFSSDVAIIYDVFIPVILCGCCVMSYMYICYPRSNTTRSLLTKVSLVILGTLTALSIGLTIFSIVTLQSRIDQLRDEGFIISDSAYLMAIVLMVVAVLIPILHCLALLLLWRARVHMADKVQAEINRGVNRVRIAGVSQLPAGNYRQMHNNV